jgi:hypothetical protein
MGHPFTLVLGYVPGEMEYYAAATYRLNGTRKVFLKGLSSIFTELAWEGLLRASMEAVEVVMGRRMEVGMGIVE